MSNDPSKPKVGVYHSELVGMGATQVHVKTGPHKSKYPNQADYFKVEVGGRDRNYTPETPGCAAVLTSHVGRKTMIQFTGSGKDGSAAITVLGAGAAPSQEPEPDDRQQEPPPDFRNEPRRERTPAPRHEPLSAEQEEAANLHKATQALVQITNLQIRAMAAAEAVLKAHMEAFPHRKFEEGDVIDVASDIAKSAQCKGVAELLPTKLMARKEAK
jgi:hypothetical protein